MMKNVSIMGVHGKIRFLVGGVHKKPIYRGKLPEKGAWTVCRFKRGLGKKEAVIFLSGGGTDIPIHTMPLTSSVH